MLWPTMKDRFQFYGDPRSKRDTEKLSGLWEGMNIKTFIPPFDMLFETRLARGDTKGYGKKWVKIRGIRCHVMVKDHLFGWLHDVWQNANQDYALIERWGVNKYGGCFHFRMMRNSKTSTLSNHALGAAIDLDAAANALGNPEPRFGQPEIYKHVVVPFLDRGGRWGGDFDRPDGMHFEFIRSD